MKNNYYVIRAFCNGRAAGGFNFGPANRFPTLAEAEGNAADFAADVLPSNPSDLIIVGCGSVRDGSPVGRGRRISRYGVKAREINGDIIRHEYDSDLL